MGKITRQTFIQFGVNVNAAADICEFGTPATGSPVYTNVIATLQALTAWTTGWAAETIANNRPFLEDMNAVCYVFSYMIAYILQMGVPEWDAGTTYFTNSIVQYNGVLYQSLIDNNLNITPVVGVSWKLVQKGFGAWTTITSGTIYQAATDGFICGYGAVTNGSTLDMVTDASASPSTLRQYFASNSSTGTNGGWGGTMPMMCPVRKGDYFDTISFFTTLYFLPWGS